MYTEFTWQIKSKEIIVYSKSVDKLNLIIDDTLKEDDIMSVIRKINKRPKGP